MKTVFMMCGLPASGKTTRAKEMLAQFGSGNAKRVSKDDLRAMLDDGKWSSANEKFVLLMRDSAIEAALTLGKHVIVDDTNLAPKHQERLKQLAKFHGAAFEVVDFTHVSVDECIERDQHRPNYVGEKVIQGMWRQFLAPPVPIIERNPALPDCILVDVDGTLTLMNGRGPFEWHRVAEDAPNASVCELVRQLGTDPRDQYRAVIFVSGRDECCRDATEYWLQVHLGTWATPLFMRSAGDMRDDRIVKREIYEREIAGKYNVLFVLNDRNRVVAFWRSLGLSCFQVADGDF
jgi:predicted kinase